MERRGKSTEPSRKTGGEIAGLVGSGEQGPTGLHRWYEPEPAQNGIKWSVVFDHWHHVTLDLHQFFGIDLSDRTLMRSRSWRWLRLRIAGLPAEGRLYHALHPDQPQGG